MTEQDRRRLYWTLLRGLAEEAQDRLCASGEQHAWSAWHNTALWPDMPFSPAPSAGGMVADSIAYRYKSERRCLNCGKTEVR